MRKVKEFYILLCTAIISCALLGGCSDAVNRTAVLENGVYTVNFDTDSSMFRVSEACDGKGKLTVSDGEMILHISLTSKNIVNLFPGLAKDAQKDGAQILAPTNDTVTYNDGLTEEVNGFDVPVSVLGEEFDLALLGAKGKWYDHKVIISNPVKADSGSKADMADGEYSIDVMLSGGGGKATVSSPASLTVKGGALTARIEWSSPNYDYMIIGENKYTPINADGNSVFEIPVTALDEPVEVVADTTAMGTPHEVEYTLTFYGNSVKKK